jgi:CheY-like chemotaxis protein
LGRIDPPFAGTTQIVELIGGAIGQTHSADGGTVFWLELPTGDLATLSKPVPDMSLPSGKHVLLVDDNATNRDVIASFLRVAGHDVTMAKNGKEAVQLAQDRTFDLVLMDVRMPEMDGLEATRRIRILPAGHGSAPVIALTAYTSEDQVTQCEDVGMTGHIAKPVDYSTLMRAVTHAMV